MATFPGPWAYGASGLGEGLAQGLMLGMQGAREKRREEMERRRQAMQLLMGFSKLPAEVAQPMIEQLAPTVGIKPWHVPTEQEDLQRQIAQMQAMEKQGFTREQAMTMLGRTPPKASVPWVDVDTGEVYGGHPFKNRMQYPPAYMGDPYHKGAWVEGPEGPVFATPGQTPGPGYSKFKPPGVGGEPKPRLMRLTDAERKAAAAATEVLENPEGKDPKEIAKARETLEGLQGKVEEGSKEVSAFEWTSPTTWGGGKKKVPTYKVTQPPPERTVMPESPLNAEMKRRGFVRGPDGKWMKPKREEE